MRAPRNISKELEELRRLAEEFRFYAGATEADYAQARAAAAKFTIALAGAPQKAAADKSWFDQRKGVKPEVPAPPRLVEVPTDLSARYPLGLNGRTVIKRLPWKHAETEHFVVHYVQASDASPVMRFIECAYFVVTQTLGIDAQSSTKKSHVFIFPDRAQWHTYLQSVGLPTAVAGFAYKDELLLGAIEEKDDYIKLLCHEATHAIMARFYHSRRGPLWLSEGLAEYMAAKAIAVRRNRPAAKYVSSNADTPMDLSSVFNRAGYGLSNEGAIPGGGSDLQRFYPNSEKCVRVLNERLPAAAFPRFVNLLVAGNSVDVSLQQAYGSACPNVAALKQLIDSTGN